MDNLTILLEVQLAITNVMCALVFGSRYELDDPEFTNFLGIMHAIENTVAAGSIVDIFPWLRFYPFKSIQHLRENCRDRDGLVGRIY